MNKNPIIKGILILFLLALPLKAVVAQAYISISASGNTLNISVNGAVYGQSVDVVYTLPGSSLQTVIANIGQVYSGTWNGSLNLNEYSIVHGSQVFARVGGHQSNTITVGGNSGGCTYNCGSPTGLSLSQNNVNLTVGQSQNVTAYNSGGSLNIISSSNPNVVSVSVVSGNQIRLHGVSGGSSTVQVCAGIYGYTYNYNNSCASIYVTVNGSVLGSNTNLWFSPANPTLYVGQSLAVSINSGANNTPNLYSNNVYYVASNSNSNVVSANVSGTVLNLRANQSGSANINICHSFLGYCGSVYVTVNGGFGSTGSGNLSFSSTNPNLSVNQNLNITVYSSMGYSGGYYVSQNTNPNAVSTSLSGNMLYLQGQNPGNSNLTICQSQYATCATLYVTVNAVSYGNLWLSQPSVSLAVGQSTTVSVNGNGNYYVASNLSPNVASANISGNSVFVMGNAPGATTISICQSGGGNQCSSLQVLVGGYFGGTPYSYGGGLSYSNPGNVLGSSIVTNGQLIQENGTVYIVYKNTKTGFVSANIFSGLGYKFSNVLNVGVSGLRDSGYVVKTNFSAHPWGTWIKNGTTVYFVHDSGLIPVPNYSTFLSNNGQDAWVVSANSYDFSLPILSNMTNGDLRLR